MVLRQAASGRSPLRIPRRHRRRRDPCAAKQPERSVVHGTRDRCYGLRDRARRRAEYRPSDRGLSLLRCHRVYGSLSPIQKFEPPRDFEIFSIHLPTVFVPCFAICNRPAINRRAENVSKNKAPFRSRRRRSGSSDDWRSDICRGVVTGDATSLSWTADTA